MYQENDLKSSKIAVVGMGVSGKAVMNYLLTTQAKALVAVDSNIDNVKAIYSDERMSYVAQGANDCAEVLASCDLVILSPGIPRELEIFSQISSKEKKLIGEIEFAYQLYFGNKENSSTKLITITGTNGKTTTVSFLDHMLKADSKIVFTGGNIGTPFIQLLSDLKTDTSKSRPDFILLELSSFQLESIDYMSPDLAVILNLSNNHAERYESVSGYFQAKWNMMKNMNENDLCIVPSHDSFVESHLSALNCKVEKVDFSNIQSLKEMIEKDYDLSSFKLIGNHNIVNLSFCLSIAKSIGLSKQAIQNSINQFSGVEHRFELCESRFDFTVINDAKSTNFDATIAAVNGLGEQSQIYLIMGGKLRASLDQELDEVKDFAAKVKGRIKKVFLIGEAAKGLEKIFNDLGLISENCGDLNGVMTKSSEVLKSDTLLFSPGFPSFDQYKNYVERGKSFKKLIL